MVLLLCDFTSYHVILLPAHLLSTPFYQGKIEEENEMLGKTCWKKQENGEKSTFHVFLGPQWDAIIFNTGVLKNKM